jgi:16S rRNA (guanine1516-N2)-methyltransferase
MCSARSQPLPANAPPPARIAILAARPPLADCAARLASETGLPIVGQDEAEPFDLLLVCTPKQLQLRDNRNPRVGPVYADFGSRLPRNGRPVLARREPLARAFGPDVATIVDATAGLAQDALRLACAGYRVTAIERHPVVAALVRDALARAAADPEIARALGGRLELRAGDARTLLSTLDPRPDAVYLDPMFPPKRRRSAAVRKELRLLRAVAGEDEDAAELFAVALATARRRVVVKRPDDAPPLAPRPAVSYEGNLVRYDVYLARPESSPR